MQLGGGGGGASASSPITICEIAATSGPFSALGTDDELGATAWAAMVNKAGGVQGHQVKLVQENDASDPATAAALVHKCVTQDHANFIFGPESTATAAAAVPVANQLQTVLLGWAVGLDRPGHQRRQPARRTPSPASATCTSPTTWRRSPSSSSPGTTRGSR